MEDWAHPVVQRELSATCASAVREVMPAEADNRAWQYGHNCAKAVGSHLWSHIADSSRFTPWQ